MNQLTAVAGKSLSLTDQAYIKIKNQLLHGHYVAGEYIELNAVMAALDMSRTPVREAFLRLKEEGLVDIIPKKGMRVSPLSSTRLKNIYQVITALELEAVALLCARGLDAEVNDHFSTILDEMRQAVDNKALTEWCLADERFHRALGDTCDNPILGQAINQYRDLAQRAHFVALRLLDDQPKLKSVEAHRSLVELIKTGAAEECCRIHREQRERGARLLIEVLQKHQLDEL